MTTEERKKRIAELEKSIKWLRWATTQGYMFYNDIRLGHEGHVKALAEAEAELAQLKANC